MNPWRILLLACLASLLAGCSPKALLQDLSVQPLQGSVAYASNLSGAYRVFVLELNPASKRDWCPEKQICTEPVWHPDGRQLALIARQQDSYRLLRLELASGAFETLYSGKTPLSAPVWSPDGKQIAFQSGSNQIMSLTPGAQAKTLSQGRFPQWASDSHQLLFLQTDQRICRWSPDEASSTCLTPTGEADFYPRWSPDGKQIAYLSKQGPSWQIALMNADGSQRRVLVPDSEAQTPAWSPDGKQIAYAVPGRPPENTASAADPVQEVWVVPMQAPERRRRLSRGLGDTLPLWLPSGNELIFQSNRGGRSGLYRVATDGKTEPQALTDGKATELLSDVN